MHEFPWMWMLFGMFFWMFLHSTRPASGVSGTLGHRRDA